MLEGLIARFPKSRNSVTWQKLNNSLLLGLDSAMNQIISLHNKLGSFQVKLTIAESNLAERNVPEAKLIEESMHGGNKVLDIIMSGKCVFAHLFNT